MISKSLTAVLLIFVAASIIVPIDRRLRNRKPEPIVLQSSILHADRVMIYYFHSHIRCPACRMVELRSRETCERDFADALTAGTIAWQAIDYQSPGYEHYVEEYQLLAASVVLVEIKGGQRGRCKTLHEAWNLAGDRKALDAYLAAEIRDFLKERR